MTRDHSSLDSQESVLVCMYNKMNIKRSNSVATYNTEQSIEMGNAWIQSPTSEPTGSNMPTSRRITLAGSSVNEPQKIKPMRPSLPATNQLTNQENARAFIKPTFASNRVSIAQSWLETTYEIEQNERIGDSLTDIQE